MDPPHIVLPLYNMRICQGQDPLFAFLPAITLLCATSGLPQDPLGFKMTSKGFSWPFSIKTTRERFFMIHAKCHNFRLLFNKLKTRFQIAVYINSVFRRAPSKKVIQ